MVVIAARNITKGEELTLCTDEKILFSPREHRSSCLLREKKFVCRCVRCCSESDNISNKHLLSISRKATSIPNIGDLLLKANKELVKSAGVVDCKSILTVIGLFDGIFGTANSARIFLYEKLMFTSIESYVVPQISDLYERIIKFYEDCVKLKIVSNVDHLKKKMIVLGYILLAQETVLLSDACDATYRRKKSRTSKNDQKELARLHQQTKHILASNFDSGMFDIDLLLCPHIAPCIGLEMVSAG
jgi:hypothetical protein